MYAFTRLPAGTYFVREELRPSWQQTLLATGVHILSLGEGEIVSGIDFGNVPSDDPLNERPQITSEPRTTAATNSLLRYDAQSHDPENDRQAFSLPLAPDGMTVHPTLGTVVWTPTEQQLGAHQVVLRVADPHGAAATQSFTVQVEIQNTPPTFTSSPAVSATATHAYQYVLWAQDADGDELSFSLEDGPDGMSIAEIEVKDPSGDMVDGQVFAGLDSNR